MVSVSQMYKTCCKELLQRESVKSLENCTCSLCLGHAALILDPEIVEHTIKYIRPLILTTKTHPSQVAKKSLPTMYKDIIPHAHVLEGLVPLLSALRIKQPPRNVDPNNKQSLGRSKVLRFPITNP